VCYVGYTFLWILRVWWDKNLAVGPQSVLPCTCVNSREYSRAAVVTFFRAGATLRRRRATTARATTSFEDASCVVLGYVYSWFSGADGCGVFFICPSCPASSDRVRPVLSSVWLHTLGFDASSLCLWLQTFGVQCFKCMPLAPTLGLKVSTLQTLTVQCFK